MYEFNLRRLMDSCCITIDLDYYDELFDYLVDIGADLNTLNIDDMVVNSISFIPEEEYLSNKDLYYLLVVVNDNAYVI